MVEQVRRYPGEVMIYSGGALTNIALAVRLDPEFASLAKGLVIMGGYLDVTLLQTSGSTLLADLNSDVGFTPFCLHPSVCSARIDVVERPEDRMLMRSDRST